MEKKYDKKKNYQKRERALYTVEIFDPRKDSIVRHLKHTNLQSWEISWISFHPHLKIKNVKRQDGKV